MLGIELVNTINNKSNSTYIDFHTDGTNKDYNSRILAERDNFIIDGNLKLNNTPREPQHAGNKSYVDGWIGGVKKTYQT